MNLKSQKVIDTEKFVDEYILKHGGRPPSYSEISKHFGISNTAAFMRCEKFRKKMKGDTLVKTEYSPSSSSMVINAEFIVPLDRFDEFSQILSCINRLLK